MIPYPADVRREKGRFRLAPAGRIVVADPQLLPLANLFAIELRAITTVQPAVVQGAAADGDIVLTIDPAKAAESYTLATGSRAEICGGSCTAVAMGTVTLLQSFGRGRTRFVAPAMHVEDSPAAPYRGLMIDLARQWHPYEFLKQAVQLCRWYKINYLHLHLTDNESFTFPSAAYPQLATPGRHYTLEQLRKLEQFAADRGVTLLPEIDVPGHSAALNKALPQVNCDPPGVHDLCPGREETYEVLDAIIGEMCDVFGRTPYFHIGADETQRKAWAGCRHCQAARRRLGLDSDEELYRHFLVRANEMVRRRGKRTIVWEGFARGGKVRVPRDVIVMEFESYYNLAPDLLADGYTVINTSWRPLYVCGWAACWPARYIHGWHMHRWESLWPISPAYKKPIEVPPQSDVIGAQMCTWGQQSPEELPSLRDRLAAMAERVWNPASGKGYSDFAARLERTDMGLSKFLYSLQPPSSWPTCITQPNQ